MAKESRLGTAMLGAVPVRASRVVLARKGAGEVVCLNRTMRVQHEHVAVDLQAKDQHEKANGHFIGKRHASPDKGDHGELRRQHKGGRNDLVVHQPAHGRTRRLAQHLPRRAQQIEHVLIRHRDPLAKDPAETRAHADAHRGALPPTNAPETAKTPPSERR